MSVELVTFIIIAILSLIKNSYFEAIFFTVSAAIFIPGFKASKQLHLATKLLVTIYVVYQYLLPK